MTENETRLLVFNTRKNRLLTKPLIRWLDLPWKCSRVIYAMSKVIADGLPKN